MDFKKSTFTSVFHKHTKSDINIQTSINNSMQFTLTPSVIDQKDENGEENKAYQPVKDIAEKLLDKDVKNIALTGPFGSGKSSILLTLQRDYPTYQYLNISLATLECDIEGNDIEGDNNKANVSSTSLKTAISPKPKESDQNNEDSLNRLIEYSILQQLIYREIAHDIPQSRFKRIKHISHRQSIWFSIGTVLFVLACIILFEPQFLHVQSLNNLFSSSKNWKIFWDLICLAYIIFAFTLALKGLIIATYNSKLNKFNIKDGEIDIAESTSIFNKHLDEIIYFFEVTKYDVVIIEDLDRFKTHSIFLKLRELNHLLNSSKAINRDNNRQIVFIYAVRDDIFKDTSRTKFFDFITTVIPIINPSNSCDKLLISLQERGIKDITDEVCYDLGIFIDDMRILKNIVNEFIQYRYKLDDKLKPEKLLSMILYKNYYPKDFTLLHNQDGDVYQLIKNKAKYYNSAVQDKEKKISALQEELKQILHFYSTQKEIELRSLYVLKYIEKIIHIQYFSENNTNYTPRQIIDSPELFQKLANNVFKHYYSNYTGTNRLNINFKDIENEVDSKHTYLQRLVMTSEKVDEIKVEIAKIQQEISELRTLPMHVILVKYPAEDFFQDAKGNKLIAFLLRQGYIDEYYYDYISYFYPGVMTASDRDFVLDIKIGRKKEYNYEIQKHKSVIEQIPDNAFVRGLMLNIGLIDFIVADKEVYSKQLQWIINYIKRKKEFGFIGAYYSQAKLQAIFFNEIFQQWNEFFFEGILKRDKNEADLNFEILLRFFPKQRIELYKNSDFIKYVSSKFELISLKIGIIGFENIKFIIDTLDIKFLSLQVKEEIFNELMSFVLKGDHYILTNENISVILYSIKQELAEKFQQASYSAILDSKNEDLIEYVNTNIDYCIKEVFSKDSLLEDEDSLIEIITNDDIEYELKKEYLQKQINKVNDLSSIDQDRWNIVIESNTVSPTWKNIEKFITIDTEAEISSAIVDFISKNSNELGMQKTSNSISESTDSKLFISLLGNNRLPLDSYRLIRKSFRRYFKSYDLSVIQSERMIFLIDTDGILLNVYNYNLIENNFPDLTLKFVLKNKSLYLSDISSYQLRANTANSLLIDGQFTVRERLSIIETLPKATFEGNSSLSNSICLILNEAGKLSVDNDFVIEVMKSCTNRYDKLSLFVKKCHGSPYDESFVKIGLKILDGDYAKIALQQGHRRKFEETKENRLLFEFLKQNNFISKQYGEDGLIRVNARNI